MTFPGEIMHLCPIISGELNKTIIYMIFKIPIFDFNKFLCEILSKF